MGLIEIILGWILTDLLSGAIHFALDRFGSPYTPLLGPSVIVHSRIHHREPLAFAAWGFFDRHRNTWMVVGLVAVLWWFWLGPSLMLASALVGGFMTPTVHYWAHRPSLAPSWARVLQSWGIFQSPKHHALHHRPPYRANYCVLTDWCNWVIHACGRLVQR